MNITYAKKFPESKIDLAILPLFTDLPAACSKLDDTDLALINSLIDAEKISTKNKSTKLIFTSSDKHNAILCIGLGKKDELTSNSLRQAFGEVAKTVASEKAQSIVLLANTFDAEPALEALELALYKFDQFKTDKEEKEELTTTVVSSREDAEAEALIARAVAYSSGTNFARDLGNLPGNHLTPSIFAEKAIAMSEEYGFNCTVLDEEEMASRGMNALLAVSAGSDEEAKMITMHYTHPEATETIALVGKGLTFDAGGISIKGGLGMQEMKFDMCGAAAVFGAMKSIGQIKPKINVLGVVPSSENLINGKAIKPGDIVTASNGKTIEIYNTDAEGRLILCDALVQTIKDYNPDKIVNLATLTGACITALGHVMAGLMSNSDEVAAELTEAGDQTYERLWRLPLNDDYLEMMKGTDADLCNITNQGPTAGTITAGSFLSQFVGDTKWAHLDIAGTAWKLKGTTYTPAKSASGFGSRLLTQWLENLAK